ncbi:ricin B-like lectin R40G2 [Panicum virgatum]|uniref:ricin B-like lectin R40G2 n=1 Tax=Panicum virgatum TaxID=38727 RepID=UPI0019D604E4|nr:ricin B-like lectin R40G2 [Panicum virgatum]
MVNNRDFILDAEEAIPDLGGARDGTRPILFRWNGGLNQQWRIAPHSTAVLARADDEDERQCWIQSFRNTGHVTDGAGHRAFALVNRATGKAPGHRRGDELVNLAGHRPDSVDVTLLWTQSDDLRQGFHNIRTVSDVDTVLDAANGVPEAGGAHDGTPIIVFPWNGGSNQNWKMLPFY